MEVQTRSHDALFEGLPCIIGLPRCWPARPDYRRTPLAEVCLPEEMPPYLLLGSLDCSRFESSDAGWSARWVDASADTHVEARFERATRQLELAQVWRGIDGGTSHTTGDDFGRGIQMLYMPFPEAWDAAAAARLEGAYRLKYFPEAGHAGFTGIPDGGFKTIGVPVPVAQLGQMHGMFETLSRDPALPVPLGGRIELRFGTINYVVGRGPEWAEDPARIYAAAFQASGLLPLGMPKLQCANDGSSAHTVERLAYLAFITVPFAGLEFVIERLAGQGLVRRRTDESGGEPGVELDAFVGSGLLDSLCSQIAWMDEGGTRRVFYLINTDAEMAKASLDRMTQAAEQSDDEARELIRQAMLVSVRQRRCRP